MTQTRVYVPFGVVGGFPGHAKHVPLGAQVGAMSAVHTTALQPNIPGVNLRQVQEVNGIAVDVAAPAGRIDMAPRSTFLKK